MHEAITNMSAPFAVCVVALLAATVALYAIKRGMDAARRAEERQLIESRVKLLEHRE